MSIEEIVRSSLDQRARQLQPPVPDPAGVRDRANRASRRRSAAAIGLAAAVTAGLVLGTDVLRDGSSSAPSSPPAPATSQDVGTVDVAPLWMLDGVLHIGDQEFPQDKEIATALVPVKSGAVYGAADGELVYQPLDGPAELVETQPGRDRAWGPAADPDSDVVAMLVWSSIDGQYDLSFYDLRRREETWSGPLSGMELEGDENPFGSERLAPIDWVGTDPNGRYGALLTGPSFDGVGQSVLHYYVRGTRGAGTLAQFSPPAYDVTVSVLADVGEDQRLTFRAPEGKELSSVDGVRADGGLSHDGSYFAGTSADPEEAASVVVVDTRTGDTRTIEAPDGSVPRHLSWAGGHTLMFVAATGDGDSSAGSVLACNADTLDCAEVADVDDTSGLVLPRL